MEASADLVINRPIEDVWAYVSNIENMDKWVNGVSEPRRASEGEFGEGSAFTSKYTYNKKTYDMAYEVTRFDPPRQMIVRSRSRPFPFEGDLELERVGNLTRVTNTIDAGAYTTALYLWFAVFGPILRIFMRRQLRKELAKLKAILEGR
ncbi:MAG: SRPBCC family protein [Chloroflexi bacterium]|nr:SRPBCC family protein [Chloroflexota bacterium]